MNATNTTNTTNTTHKCGTISGSAKSPLLEVPITNPEQYKLSAAQLFNIYGIGRNALGKMLSTRWNITEQHSHCLAEYYLLNYAGYQFASKLAASKRGTINKNGIEYQIIYDDCLPEQCKAADELWLSFRTATKHFALPSYVIVRTHK